MKRKIYFKRKKTEQEETKKRFLHALLLFIIYYLLFIIYYLLFIIYCLFPYPLSPDRFLKRDGELVRTACAFRATLNALETGNHVFCLLAFDQ